MPALYRPNAGITIDSFMPDVSALPITLTEILAPGIAAVRKYWKPLVLLQGASLLLVISYFANARVAAACTRLSDFKNHAGLIFSAISAAFAGAVLPELAKAVMLGDRSVDRQRVRNIVFAVAVFGLNGMLTDLQYRGAAWLFGNDNHFSTVIKKTLFDQFVTTPFYGTPYWLMAYSLRVHRYNALATARQVSPQWYLRTVLPLLIPAWAMWLPMVVLIFSLPVPLQFCLFCFALAAWSLLMVFVATNQAEAEISNPAA